MDANLVTLAKLSAEIGVPYATLARRVEDLKIAPRLTLNGIAYYSTRDAERLSATFAAALAPAETRSMSRGRREAR